MTTPKIEGVPHHALEQRIPRLATALRTAVKFAWYDAPRPVCSVQVSPAVTQATFCDVFLQVKNEPGVYIATWVSSVMKTKLKFELACTYKVAPKAVEGLEIINEDIGDEEYFVRDMSNSWGYFKVNPPKAPPKAPKATASLSSKVQALTKA